MPNNYFQFKQFTIYQDKCAMKVCTDACLFGSMLPVGANQVLDIGTGTGLLSLMLAQRDPGAVITAVELDEQAAQQAAENFSASPWKERLSLIHADIFSYKPPTEFDLIVSNPPFFENDLHSPNDTKNKAKHDTTFSLTQLLDVSEHYLASGGTLAVLLPHHRVDYFIDEARKRQLYLRKQALVKQTEKHGFFRGVLFFSREKTETVYSEMSIKDSLGNYTAGFSVLLKDYYLYLG